MKSQQLNRYRLEPILWFDDVMSVAKMDVTAASFEAAKDQLIVTASSMGYRVGSIRIRRVEVIYPKGGKRHARSTR